MPRLLAAISAALLFAAPAYAELNPDEVGKIQAEQKQAVEKIRAENGNKSEKDMTPEERRQQGEAESQASEAVLQKHGVSDKEYTRYTDRMDRSAQADAKASEQAAESAARAPAAAAKTESPAEEVKIQHGVDEDHPMEINVQEKENGVDIDRGTPVSELDKGGDSEPAPKPSRSSSHHSSHHTTSTRHHRRGH